jgi:hypothetical protein
MPQIPLRTSLEQLDETFGVDVIEFDQARPALQTIILQEGVDL